MQMKDKPNDLLLLAGKMLTIFGQIFIAIGAIALSIAIPALLFFRDNIEAEIIEEFGPTEVAVPIFALLGILVIGLAILVLAWMFLGKLRAIISSVGEGDPFVPENAERLTVMAWLALGTQVLMIPAGALGLVLAKWADEMEHADITIDAGLDIEGLLMVIVLFILARVFKHGASMREDLEGTV